MCVCVCVRCARSSPFSRYAAHNVIYADSENGFSIVYLYISYAILATGKHLIFRLLLDRCVCVWAIVSIAIASVLSHFPPTSYDSYSPVIVCLTIPRRDLYASGNQTCRLFPWQAPVTQRRMLLFPPKSLVWHWLDRRHRRPRRWFYVMARCHSTHRIMQ